MFTAKTRYIARGFVSGAVVTASVCYSVFLKLQTGSTVDYDEAEKVRQFHPFGKPIDQRTVLYYTGHSCYYDASKKQPLWVSQVLTKDNLQGRASRSKSKFKKDSQIPEHFTAENSDYWKSGWSRGHMAPAGDFKFSQTAMDDTFYLTNIVPQDLDNNSGFWNRLETHCRDLVKRFDRIHIVSGPVYRYNKEINNKRYVEHEVIGKNLVPVPTHLYKVVVAYNDEPNFKPLVAAFLVPNKPIDKEHDELTKYQVSLAELSSYTGFTFHPNLGRDRQADLCQYDDNICKLTNWKEFELYFAYKNLKTAKTEKDITDIMKKLKRKGIKPSEEFLELLEKRSKDLGSPQPVGKKEANEG